MGWIECECEQLTTIIITLNKTFCFLCCNSGFCATISTQMSTRFWMMLFSSSDICSIYSFSVLLVYETLEEGVDYSGFSVVISCLRRIANAKDRVISVSFALANRKKLWPFKTTKLHFLIFEASLIWVAWCRLLNVDRCDFF